MAKRMKICLMSVLAIIMSLCTVFAGCGLGQQESPVKEIAFKQGTVVEYEVGETIDYSKITIIATKEDGSTQELKLTDEGVEYNQIDTAEEGEQTLTATYAEKSVSITVTIVVAKEGTPVSFTLPQAYSDYKDSSKQKEDSEKLETEFFVKGNPYVVGSQNKFEFVPEVIDEDLEDIVNPKTTFKLYEMGKEEYEEVADALTYVVAENNMYKFKDSAIGKSFKMEISLDSEAYDLSQLDEENTKIEIEFIVKKAYNVYNTFGLSVMDNLNVKNWAEIKNQTLKWDDKKLSEYTDVELVVLQNDVTVNADELPANYFWSEEATGYQTALANVRAADSATNGETNFEERLIGSLRDGTEGNSYSHTESDENIYNGKNFAESWDCENMQKGFFNTNKCSIEGNYMTVSLADSDTRHLSQVLSHDYNSSKTKTMTNPVSHWHIFKFYKTDDLVKAGKSVDVTVDNLRIIGNMQKENKQGMEAGPMGINSFVDSVTVNNVITTQLYSHMLADGNENRGESKLIFNDVRMFDAYSNMVYLWRSKVDMTNCILKNAGGPLFIMCDGERTETGLQDTDGPVLTIDDKTVLESFATGTEAWYDIWDAGALLNNLKAMSGALESNDKIGKGFVHEYNEVQQINIIAAMLPTPGTIMSPASPPINAYGMVNRIHNKGTAEQKIESFAMNDMFVSAVKAANTVCFNSGNQYAFVSGVDTQTGAISAVSLLSDLNPYAPSDFVNSSSDWLQVTMSVNAAAGVPYFSAIIGNFGVAPTQN